MDLDDLLDDVAVKQPSPTKEPTNEKKGNDEWGDVDTAPKKEAI